jgi:hypothetical protein
MISTKDDGPRTKDKGRRQWALLLVLGLLTVVLGAGCRQNCHLVERELRDRERELREMRAELDHVHATNEVLQHELCENRKGRPAVRETPPAENPPELIPPPKIGAAKPEPAAMKHTALETVATISSGPIKELVLGRGTGGYTEGRCAGDDSLQVVVEPRDCDGHSLKVAGCLRVTALEVLPEGLKKPLSTWDVPAVELRRTWRSGLFSTGYFVVLPWKCPPSTEKLRVIVQFEMADGRLFEADKDVTIHLPPASLRKPPAESVPTTHTAEKPIRPIAAWQPAPPLNTAVRLLRPE